VPEEDGLSVPFASAALMLLLAAAWRDIVTRTIPNAVCLLLLTVGVIARMFAGPLSLALSGGAALLLFLLLMVAFSRGFIGGGDVKLMVTFAVGVAPLDCYRFVIATAIAGGVLAIVYLILSRCLRAVYEFKRTSLPGRVCAIEAWRIRRRGPLPYGVAIAAGGTFVLLQVGSF
jgi:prepilin peptidase CpaA